MSMQALREKMDTLPTAAGDATAANQTAIRSKTDLIGTSADVANELGTSLFGMIKYVSTVVDGILANVLSIQAQTSYIGSSADVANQSGSSLFSIAKYIATAPGVVSAGGGYNRFCGYRTAYDAPCTPPSCASGYTDMGVDCYPTGASTSTMIYSCSRACSK
ncbi:MAG: hypothetical protein HQK58_17705 [Deltaproteobacteria bacterium]|nr:hypothetical protein [Deltaproteobacteria bacterium]